MPTSCAETRRSLGCWHFRIDQHVASCLCIRVADFGWLFSGLARPYRFKQTNQLWYILLSSLWLLSWYYDSRQSWSFLVLKCIVSIVKQREASGSKGKKEFVQKVAGWNTSPHWGHARLNVCSAQFVARQHWCTRGVARGRVHHRRWGDQNAIICSVGRLTGFRVGERFCVNHGLVSRIESGVWRTKMTKMTMNIMVLSFTKHGGNRLRKGQVRGAHMHYVLQWSQNLSGTSSSCPRLSSSPHSGWCIASTQNTCLCIVHSLLSLTACWQILLRHTNAFCGSPRQLYDDARRCTSDDSR